MRSFNERVSTDDIMNAAVTSAKLASGAAAGSIGAGAITGAMLANDATTQMIVAADAVQQPALPDIYGLGAVPVWVKFVLSYTAVKALGAALTGSLAPADLVIPAGTVIHDAVLNVTAAFVGCTTLVVNVGDNESATDLFTAVNLKSAVATGADLVLPYTAADQVNLAFTSTVNDLNSLTAGSATLYLLCSALD